MSTRITKKQARDELKYRSLPKPRPARDFDPGKAFNASGPELLAIAGPVAVKSTTSTTSKPSTSKSKKSTPARKALSAAEQNAKLLRGQAWDMRCAAVAAGQKLTYAQACEALGVKPARAA
jgi:hypothetical protein